MKRGARPYSLRWRLLAWIWLPLAVLLGLNAWVSYVRAVDAANEAYDRALYMAARALAEELEWQQGRLQLDMRRGAGYLFDNHTGSRLFYKVNDMQGQHLLGDASLPEVQGRKNQVRFFSLLEFEDAQHKEHVLRLAQLIHALPDAQGQSHLLRLTVAETRETREALIQHMLRDTLGSQGLLLLAAGLLVLLAVRWAMRPLEVIRKQMERRADDDFSPLATRLAEPQELQPLLQAINGYLQRLGRLIGIRKRFLDNAAHQLRTPLTVLKTQLSLMEREDTVSHALVHAAHRTANDAVRLTEQLLALTRVEHGSDLQRSETVDLVALARQVTQEQLARAHERGDDLGFETQVASLPVQGVTLLLHEALTNLLDNALHHSPPGGQLTVRVGRVWVEVQDQGPGIAPEHQAHVFERFYRAAAPGVSGSGLGLAIVQEIARQHGVQIILQSPLAQGHGTCVRLQWPV